MSNDRNTMVYIERQESNGYLYSFFGFAEDLEEALECLAARAEDDAIPERGDTFLIRRYAGGPILAKLELCHESNAWFNRICARGC